MPLLSIVRFLFAIPSWLVLGTAGYLLWRWFDGTEGIDPDGTIRIIREDWMLWTGIALAALSLVGGWIWTPLLAKPDTADRSSAEREMGRTITGVGGTTLYLEEHGPVDAPPIVLTHGWGNDSTIWLRVRRRLEKRFRLILWDLPGLGKSRLGSEKLTLEHVAANLALVLDTVGKDAVVVGHSLGGMSIQTLARDQPHRFGTSISGVILLNTTFTNPLKTMILSRLLEAIRVPIIEPLMRLSIWLFPLAWVSAWQSYLSGAAHLATRIEFGPHVTRSQLNHATLLSVRSSPAVLQKGNLAMFHWDATGAMANVPVPVLVIGGDKDIVTKPEASRMIAVTSPVHQLEVVSDANHMGHVERAERYAELIEAFMLRLDPSAT